MSSLLGAFDWILLKKRNAPFRIKNPDLDFSKETHPDSRVSISQAGRGVATSRLATFWQLLLFRPTFWQRLPFEATRFGRRLN